MGPTRKILIGVLLAAGIAPAQQLTITDVVNAGSRLSSLSPGAGISQGALFVAMVRGIGAGDLQQATFPLPTTGGLAGVTMQIASQGAVIDAIMVYVAANEAAAILPSTTPLGPAVLTVNKNGITSTRNINVIGSAFGIFVQTANAGGNGAALAFNVNGDGSTTLNRTAASVMPGQDMEINGTGLGAIPSDETQPGVADVPDTSALKVYVGTLTAPVVSAGRGACCDGVDASYRVPRGIAAWDVIRFTVPAGITGCYVPVVVQTGNYVSNLAVIAIDPGGAQCNRGMPAVPDDLAQKLDGKTGVSLAALSLGRNFVNNVDRAGAPTSTKLDQASANFLSYPGVPAAAFTSDYEYPNYVCTVGGYPTANGGATRDGQPAPVEPLKEVNLDAGPAITIKGPAGTRMINRIAVAGLVGYQTQSNFGNATPGNYLDPGTYTLTGTGGKDVGALTATITVPATPFVWTNAPLGNTPIDRTQDFTVKWTGGAPGTRVLINASSGGAAAGGAVGGFSCHAPVEDGQFTIPAWVFLSIPATPTTPATSRGLMDVSNTTSAHFTATGIDVGTISYNALTRVELRYVNPQ